MSANTDRTLRDDIRSVLTVYDEHVAPENRGPWRDRLDAFVNAPPTASEVTAESLLGEVVDWCGAADWSGPQLPDHLGRRIARAADRYGWWAAQNGSSPEVPS